MRRKICKQEDRRDWYARNNVIRVTVGRVMKSRDREKVEGGKLG